MSVATTINYDGRFDRIDAQFELMRKQFILINKRFNKVDENFSKINDKFNRIDDKFSEVDDKFTKIDSQLDKLTTLVIKGFDWVSKELDKKADKEDVNQLYNLMDSMAKQQEIDNDERLVMGHQLERLDRWAHEVANKIGYKLSI